MAIPASLAPLTLALAVSAPAGAQLTPTRLYYGIGRAIPMNAAIPAGAPGDITIDLFAPAPVASGAPAAGTDQPLASAPAVAGAIDLATRFPLLWAAGEPRLLYAQLTVGGRRIGPPVVLQPMLSPNMAMLVDPVTFSPAAEPAAGVVMFDDARLAALDKLGKSREPRTVVYSGLRAFVDRNAVFDTTLGSIEFRLRPDQAPNTAWNFRELVDGGFYTDIIFHRVVANTDIGAPFVIQTGDPNGTGDGGPGYNIDLEPSRLPHDFGVLSMARDTDPNTNGSQVFIALSREATARLDGKYTAFAQAVRGGDTILATEKVALLPDAPPQPGEPPATPKSRPKDPPVIRSAYLVDAPPYGEGPGPVARPVPAVPR